MYIGRTITSEKENGFIVMLKWRYEDSGPRLVQLRKKIQQLRDKLLKEQESLRRMKDSYEKLLNYKGGDGQLLIDLWGLAIDPDEVKVFNSPGGLSGFGNDSVTSGGANS